MIVSHLHTPRWQRHPVAVRRLASIRDELLAEAATHGRHDETRKALHRAARAIGTALCTLREAQT